MIRFCKILIFFILSQQSLAFAEETIYWQIYHRPPGIFTQGTNIGEGFIQKALKLIIAEMPEYHHEMVTSSLARALRDIKNEKPVCHPALFNTPERTNFAKFSLASIVHPTNRIVMRNSLAGSFSASRDSGIHLQSLLVNEQLTFALIEGRKFGSNIDKMMSVVNLGERLLSIPSENLGNMLQMVSLGRADVTLAYPFEIEHFNTTLSAIQEPLKTFEIKNASPYSMGFVACPNNQWGKQVVTRINRILGQIRHTEIYRDAVTTWWKEEAKNPAFDSYYKNIFLNN